MPVKFPSEEWIKELCTRLNASVSYAQAAATWEGDQIFVILPDENYKETTYFYLNLQHGKASHPRQLRSLDEQKASFTSAAPFGIWRKVLEGRLDPIQAIFSNKIKLTGSMLQVQRTPKATYELVRVAGTIESDFGL
jgi:putative sterol carrier protein